MFRAKTFSHPVSRNGPSKKIIMRNKPKCLMRGQHLSQQTQSRPYTATSPNPTTKFISQFRAVSLMRQSLPSLLPFASHRSFFSSQGPNFKKNFVVLRPSSADRSQSRHKTYFRNHLNVPTQTSLFLHRKSSSGTGSGSSPSSSSSSSPSSSSSSRVNKIRLDRALDQIQTKNFQNPPDFATAQQVGGTSTASRSEEDEIPRSAFLPDVEELRKQFPNLSEAHLKGMNLEEFVNRLTWAVQEAPKDSSKPIQEQPLRREAIVADKFEREKSRIGKIKSQELVQFLRLKMGRQPEKLNELPQYELAAELHPEPLKDALEYLAIPSGFQNTEGCRIALNESRGEGK